MDARQVHLGESESRLPNELRAASGPVHSAEPSLGLMHQQLEPTQSQENSGRDRERDA